MTTNQNVASSDLSVSKEIYRQLGGMTFAMIGAKNFIGTENSLKFKIGSNSEKVSYILITLEPSDTYRVAFLSRSGGVLSEVGDVYVDSLHAVIESHTGLYTSL